MKRADQMYRNKNYKENIAKQDSIDKIHEKRLIEIFKTVGYPTERIVGQTNMDNHVDVELMLLHTDDSIRINYFVPKIKEFVKNGTASPLTLGRIIDQYYLYNGEPQIYGTYRAQGGGYANMINDLKKLIATVSPLDCLLGINRKKDSLVRAKYGF